MRTRLSVLLLVLMGVVLVSLGVPLAAGIAAGEARSLHADRVADLALFVSRVPTGAESPAVRAAAVRDLRRYDDLFGIAVSVYDPAGRLLLSSRPGPAAGPAGPGPAADPAGPGPAADPAGPDPAAGPAEWSGPDAELVRPAVRTALAGRLTEAPDRLVPWEDRPLVAAQPVVADGDVVGAVVSVSPVDRARSRVLNRWLLLVGAELVALVGAAVLASRLAGWLLRPVARLDEAAHQISAGDLGARVPAGSGPPELRRLEHSFNDMAVHVQEAVEAQRAFVADASHQLRNPLAALLIRLEGLQLAPPSWQPEAAERALADGRHLAGTLDRMLALARVEHTGASAGPVDVGALVDERLASWRVVAERRSIGVERGGVARAVGHHEAGALAGALDAVLDNSLKYSPANSTVTVEVVAGASSVAVVVTDDGPGVAEVDLPKVVDRFWRSDGASRQSGTGLGMSIAKTLLERHGGRLDVATADHRGLRVGLHVPREPPPETTVSGERPDRRSAPGPPTPANGGPAAKHGSTGEGGPAAEGRSAGRSVQAATGGSAGEGGPAEEIVGPQGLARR